MTPSFIGVPRCLFRPPMPHSQAQGPAAQASSPDGGSGRAEEGPGFGGTLAPSGSRARACSRGKEAQGSGSAPRILLPRSWFPKMLGTLSGLERLSHSEASEHRNRVQGNKCLQTNTLHQVLPLQLSQENLTANRISHGAGLSFILSEYIQNPALSFHLHGSHLGHAPMASSPDRLRCPSLAPLHAGTRSRLSAALKPSMVPHFLVPTSEQPLSQHSPPRFPVFFCPFPVALAASDLLLCCCVYSLSPSLGVLSSRAILRGG